MGGANMKKDQYRDSTSLDNSNKDTNLLIECTLIGGLLPYSKNLWNNEEAILKIATGIIEQRHMVEPFKTAKP